MTRREALIGLNLLYEIGPRRAKALCAFFKEPRDIFRAPVEQLCTVCGIREKTAQSIRALSLERILREIEKADQQGVGIISWDDPEYPEAVRSIYDPPLVLYVKGHSGCLQARSLAVVGSRKASFYGRKHARQFAYALARAGFCIVSGMARGIDTCAHEGALEAGGLTIAVMGSGFNNIYPPENRQLAERVAQSGAVITELAMDAGPLKTHFPRRNRIISALSEAVLVVEAARTSGALITADCALEQGREVFALPGQIDSVGADGTNALISQGAHIALAPEDIIDVVSALPSVVPVAAPVTAASGTVERPAPDDPGACVLSADEQAVRALFAEAPQTIDELIERSGMHISRISAILLALQVKKIINQLPGKYYQLQHDEKDRSCYR